MKKRFYSAFTFLSILILAACSTTDKAPMEKEIVNFDQPVELDKSLLWEISGNDLEESSFLFGTIHMIDGKDFFLPTGTLSAIDVSKKMIFELDMAEMTDPMKLMPLMQKAFMKGDTTLKDLMTTEDYDLVQGHFNEMGLPLFFLERIKPMFLTVFASGDIDAEGLQNGKVKSYEMEFVKMADENNKETAGLETVEYQISVFDGIPYKEQANMLVETIKSGNTEDDTFKELVNLYLQQDIQGLYDMMKQDDSIEEYEDALLNDRNKNWIPLMKQEMLIQRTFFAVGAGHLGGKEGVINLLKEAGYSVKAYRG